MNVHIHLTVQKHLKTFQGHWGIFLRTALSWTCVISNAPEGSASKTFIPRQLTVPHGEITSGNLVKLGIAELHRCRIKLHCEKKTNKQKKTSLMLTLFSSGVHFSVLPGIWDKPSQSGKQTVVRQISVPAFCWKKQSREESSPKSRLYGLVSVPLAKLTSNSMYYGGFNREKSSRDHRTTNALRNKSFSIM